MDCFSSLISAPLNYAIGGVLANAEGLKDKEDISDPLSLKWTALAVLGFESEVVAGITLFNEASFSTHIVEQAHALCSLIMRRHPMLETSSLLCRMTVHNCRMLICRCPFQKAALTRYPTFGNIGKQIANVHKAGPKQMYLKALIGEVKAQRLPAGLCGLWCQAIDLQAPQPGFQRAWPWTGS